MKTWPMLFKKTKTGAIQQWQITLEDTFITVAFGQVNGAIQTELENIKEGKNTGKANETTAIEQAHKEAQARWEKQVKKGYVEKLEDAESGRTELGGVAPMLAHTLEDHESKLKYPCRLEPKLDGARCIAIWDGVSVTLWSRTRKPILSAPHIIAELERNLKDYQALTLDGELYSDSLKADFERLMSLIRQTNKPHKDHELLEYHVYDAIPPAHIVMTQKQRTTALELLEHHKFYDWKAVKFVKGVYVNNKQELMVEYQRYKNQGYEGAIARNLEGIYIHNRSHDLLKVKKFMDAEFKIVGVEEGRGRLAGHGIFVCEVKPGRTFSVKLEGPTGRLAEIWENKDSYIGKQLTVSYQNLSGYGIPRFPVGVRIRLSQD